MEQRRTLGWPPERIWVLVVGLLEWKHTDIFAPFPQEQRQDAALVAFFREQGIPERQIAYLHDREATTPRIQRALEQHLAAAGPDDLLILYFCGHGGKTDAGATYFASYEADGDAAPGWLIETIAPTIEGHFAGSHVLLAADCCYSGSLAELIAVHQGRIAYACLASSLSSETSTGNWTFTETLLAGLRGEAFADMDSNGHISLGEMAAQVMATMAFAEEQIATFAISGGFDPHVPLARAQPRPAPPIGQRVAVKYKEGWYRGQIVAARGKQVKIHYYGYTSDDDEWVDADRVREVARPAYPIGATVEVQWRRQWCVATILDVREGIHYIQYEGYGSEWNEWVALKRIRPLTSA